LKLYNHKNISIGKRCSFGGEVQLHAYDEITIGDDCLFAYGVILTTAGHDYKETRMNHSIIKKPITICDNVWLGVNAIILPGVTIGNGAVIGAGSVVTKDVPPNVVVIGNPAKILKFRYEN
jgi:acetyltransferase-like isoleucine patch superfamily enzyme